MTLQCPSAARRSARSLETWYRGGLLEVRGVLGLSGLEMCNVGALSGNLKSPCEWDNPGGLSCLGLGLAGVWFGQGVNGLVKVKGRSSLGPAEQLGPDPRLD